MKGLERISLSKKIEINYAFVQALYWSCTCALSGFVAVFLSYKGLNNSEIGITTSLMYVIAILLQLFISNFSDKHSDIPLKNIITAMLIFTIVCVMLMLSLPLPIAFIMLLFSVSSAVQTSNNGLLNALFIQYSNTGMKVDYGWPRGFGSIGYAASAYIFGILIERYSPDILLILYLLIAFGAIIAVLFMPKVESSKKSDSNSSVSYLSMMKSNSTLTLFLLALIFVGIGQSVSSTFLIRIIENLGGGNEQLGMAMFIQSGVELPIMFVSGLILKRFKSNKILLFSFICYFLKAFMLAFCTSLTILYIIMFFSIFCFGLYGFSSVIFINEIVEEGQMVRGQSLVSLCFTGGIGSIVGNLISGYLIDNLGLQSVLHISWILCFIGAIFMVLCYKSYIKKFED